jgi:condensin complex subunit 2
MPGRKEKITGEGLDELCNNALQLVTDNKVNMKNAFDVELIEHIGELMQRYQSGDGEMNFHRAAGTLDASARIYAYRVDQVHNDVFKVKGSIMQLGEDDKENGGAGTTRKASKNNNQHLEVMRNITLGDVEQDDKVDGYFKQMARKLENGGSKALLLNILPYGPDGVVFDGMQKYQEVNKESKPVGDGAAPSQIPHLEGRIAPNLGQLLPAELFLDSVNLSADDETVDEDSVQPESPAPEAPLSPVKSMADEDAVGFDDEPAIEPADGAGDFGLAVAEDPDELGADGYNDEVDFLLDHVCVDSDFAFFDDAEMWQTRRKAKKDAKEKAEKEKAEKKEKVSFDMMAAFSDKLNEDIQIDVESANKHTVQRKRAKKKPELWDALTTSTWPANPDSFFRLDWLDRLLPPKSKNGKPDLENPGAGLAVAPDDDGAFCEGDAFADVLDDPMCAEDVFPPEETTELCVAEAPVPSSVPGHVNVARVKQGMRTALAAMLSSSDEPSRKRMKADPAADSAEELPKTTFMELVENVRSGMPAGEKSSLTVAIAFICTLHMCNENNLELERLDGDCNFGDFDIVRRDPPPEIGALCC